MNANEMINLDPARTHRSASELSQKQIDELFQSLPWCDYLVLVNKTTITRKEWKADRVMRAERDATSKGVQ